jgi:hypothetical protein
MTAKSDEMEIISMVQAHLRLVANASIANTPAYDLRVASNSLRFLLC